MLKTSVQVLRRAHASGARIVHFHDPELIPIGLLLKLSGRRVVYDVHEDLPTQIKAKDWISPPLRRVVAGMARTAEWIGARAFDGIVAATPEIASNFPANKTVTVQNFPIIEEFAQEAVTPYSERGRKIAYVGGISQIRGALEMSQAMALVGERLDAVLELAGPVSSTDLLEALERSPAWSRVNYHGVLPRDAVAQLLGSARVGLVTLHPLQNYRVSFPVKMFEYMAAGLPVIASDFPLWRSIVEGASAGFWSTRIHPGKSPTPSSGF